MAAVQAITCRDWVEQVTDYLEGALPDSAGARFEGHLAECAGCQVYLQQMRLTIGAVAALREEAVTDAEKARLLELLQHVRQGAPAEGGRAFRLGIGDAFVGRGDHIAYFWETDQEFAEGVGFLDVGLRGKDACFVFGHDQANRKVLRLLGESGFDPGRLIAAGQLTVLGGQRSSEQMMATIAAHFQRAVVRGTRLLRLLGNIGWGQSDWPGDDDILAFEARVTEAARHFPCAIVCMYDVRGLPGRIILKGGFETHPLTFCGHGLRENPYHVHPEVFLARLKGEQALGKPQ